MAREYVNVYENLRTAGCEIDHHESDLYVMATPEAVAIVKASGWTFERFRSQVDGRDWLDVAFGYTPYWEAKQAKATPLTVAKHTPTPWRANAIADGRIIGDATTPGAEKIQINGANNTIATVYRSSDAMFLQRAVNTFDEVRAELRGLVEVLAADSDEMRAANTAFVRVRAILAKMESDT